MITEDAITRIAMSLEKFLIPYENWTEEVWSSLPNKEREILEEEIRNPSGPIGIAYVPDWGYCILASGQGPFVVWSEFDVEEYYASPSRLNAPKKPFIISTEFKLFGIFGIGKFSGRADKAGLRRWIRWLVTVVEEEAVS